jgi:DNA helicase-2/ATP-dependent DNA helicase PcrA
LIEPFLVGPDGNKPDREPPELRGAFDEARRFYVAFSRAENLLIVPRANRYTGSETEKLLDRAADLSTLDSACIPEAKMPDGDLPRNYSYTGDYSFYKQCPRRYMAFRKYGFTGSRTQHMMFGVLVHRTIEDLHRKLLEAKEAQNAKQ